MSEPPPSSHLPTPDRETYHLVPEPVWLAQAGNARYEPEAFAAEGFIHATHGEANLLTVGNTFYQDDPRPFVVLVVDLDRVDVPVRYEDAERIYPHLHGPLARSAVVAVRPAVRLADGSFAGIG